MQDNDLITNRIIQGKRNPDKPDIASIDYDAIVSQVDAAIENDENKQRSMKIKQMIIDEVGNDEFFQLPLDQSMELIKHGKPAIEAIEAYELLLDTWERRNFFDVACMIYKGSNKLANDTINNDDDDEEI